MAATGPRLIVTEVINLSSAVMGTFQSWMDSHTALEVEMHRGGSIEIFVKKAFLISARDDGDAVLDCCAEPDTGYSCELRIFIPAATSKLFDASNQAEPVRSIDPRKAFIRQIEMLLPTNVHFYLNEMEQLR